jgi:hypothetical protein
VRLVCAWALIESPFEDGPVKTGNPLTKRAASRASIDVFIKIGLIAPSILINGLSVSQSPNAPTIK